MCSPVGVIANTPEATIDARGPVQRLVGKTQHTRPRFADLAPFALTFAPFRLNVMLDPLAIQSILRLTTAVIWSNR